jgi:hypothetical protein
MVAIHFMHYNFGKVHKTLRVSPAMEAGFGDHIWSLEEVVLLANWDPTKFSWRWR